jgi:AcrR family transcriptional regulator
VSSRPRGEVTRERILRRAEQLFARHGVEGVTLRQIARAARQRNVAAVQYHFGGKQELLDAILGVHLDGIDRRRRELLDAHERMGEMEDIDALLSVLVDPLVEKLDEPSGRAYLRIQAGRPGADPMRPATRTMANRFGRAFGLGPGHALAGRFAVLLLFGALADRAEAETSRDPEIADRDHFVELLKAAIRGIYNEAGAVGPARSRRLAG